MTEIFVPPDTNTQLSRFSPTDAAIADMGRQFMPLIIRDVNDTVGAKAVHSARMVVRDHRVKVEKVRKELKADALEYGRKVDAEAKRITGLLEPIENHLTQQEDAYEAAKEQIRNAARLKAEAEERARQEAEAKRIQQEREAEEARLSAERERLDEEQRKIDEQRREIEAEKQRLAAIEAERQREIEAEKKRLADIEAARLRKLENERIATEAAERARIETEQRLAREAEEKIRRDKEAEEARLRAEALRPDREKLIAVAAKVRAIAVPSVCFTATEARLQIEDVLNAAAKSIEKIAQGVI